MRVNLEARARNAELRRERTRERLIAAALSVLADKGPDMVSVEDFVAAAQVSRGTFYNYFPTTDELIAALNDHLTAAYDKKLDAVIAGERDPAMIVALIPHEVFRSVAQDPVRAWVALKIEGSAAPRSAVLAARFEALFDWAVAQGRFHDISRPAARTLMFGALRLAIPEMVAGRADLTDAEEIVAMLLIAYGVDRAEARRLSADAVARVRGPVAA